MVTGSQVTQDKLFKLKAALKGVKRLYILTHDNPDPDSISCAIVLKTLVTEMFHVPACVRYSGIVGRAENREMIRILGLKLRPLGKQEIHAKDAIALVDCQPHTGNITLPKKHEPLIVIDHHPLRKTTHSTFFDLRQGYGATATILGEYLLASGLDVTCQLATALCYGISSETQHLGREASAADAKVYSELFSVASKKSLSKIENPKLSQDYFVTLNHALHQSYLYKNAVVSKLGDIAQPDFVHIVADLLLRCERVSWSLAMGRYEDRIILSMRTTREKAQAGTFLRKLVGKRGTAGGHGMIAGGQIPCKKITDGDCQSIENEITQEFLKRLGYKDPGEMTPLLMKSDSN